MALVGQHYVIVTTPASAPTGTSTSTSNVMANIIAERDRRDAAAAAAAAVGVPAAAAVRTGKTKKAPSILSLASHCNCTSDCMTKRCACKKSGNKCSAKCHASYANYSYSKSHSHSHSHSSTRLLTQVVVLVGLMMQNPIVEIATVPLLACMLHVQSPAPRPVNRQELQQLTSAASATVKVQQQQQQTRRCCSHQ